jgi:hypothetical protein
MMMKWSESTTFVDEVRQDTKFWLVTNGIDPHLVPVGGFVEKVDETHIKVEMFVRDEDGGIKCDYSTGVHPLFEWVTFEAPMPPDYLLEELEQ